MSFFKKQKIGLTAGFVLILLSFCFLTLLSPSAEGGSALENTYYTVTAVPNDTAKGSVTVTPKDSNSKNEYGQFRYRTEVDLVAVPAAGYRFVRWESSATVSGGSTLTHLVTGDASFTAIFEPCVYEITYDYGNYPWMVFPSDKPAPTTHTYGTAVELPVPANSHSGYTFAGWNVTSINAKGEEFTVVYEYPPIDGSGLFAIQAGTCYGVISLSPVYNPNPYDVTCIDKIKNEYGDILDPDDTIVIHSFYGMSVSGRDAAPTVHRGYYFPDWSGEGTDTYASTCTVGANSALNVVERYYQAKTYRIIYQNCTMPESAAQLHTFGTGTFIQNPVKTGYTFLGWTVENWDAQYHTGIDQTVDCTVNNLVIAANAYDHPEWTYESRDSDEYAIVLTARWQVKTFDVILINEGVESSRKRSFDEDFVLPDDLTRSGYTFIGWRLEGSSDEFRMNYQIPAYSSAENLRFVAGWEANGYTVTLNPNASDAVGGDTSVSALFGSELSAVTPPARTGYTFLGYFLNPEDDSTRYFDADGNWVSGKLWDQPRDTVLYAKWQINQYNVSVSITGALSDNAVITVGGQTYDGTPIAFDYRTSVTVTVRLSGAGKLIKWNGSAIAHVREFTYSFTLEENTVLSGLTAVTEETPNFRVQYTDEIFTVTGGIPAGEYILRQGSDEVRFSVGADGIITFENGSTADRFRASQYFGTTVQVIRCGNGETSADSDAQGLSVAGRPPQPMPNDEIDYISALDNSIEVVMSGRGSYVYEYACSATRSADGVTGLTWVSNPLFLNLKSGTPYYIYVRVAASETYPHGEVYETTGITLSAQYLQNQIDRLMDLRQTGDGDNVDRLIQTAVDSMNGLQPAPDYVERMEDIYQSVADGIAFARAQDSGIAELRALCASLQDSGAYSEQTGIPALNAYLDAAVSAIDAAKTESEVQRLVSDAKNNFYSVLISYLYYANDFLLSCNGIDRNFRLVASRVTDLGSVSSPIQRAIKAGTIVVGGTQMTLADATAALRTLDVLGYYNLQLLHSNSATSVKAQGPFEIRLLIPEDLRSSTGLLVAYYESSTEKLTVLDTRRDGNYLIFTADTVSGFVILGDHDVNLTGLIAALGATLLFQMIAILILVIRRRKFAKEYRSYSLVPLAALTVRFLPERAAEAVLLMGILVVLLQIILMWLLLTSDIVRRGRKPRKARREADLQKNPSDSALADEAQTASADSMQEEDADEPYLTALSDGIPEEEAYEELDDYPADGDSAAEEPEPVDAPVYEPDPEPAELQQEDWYGDNSFIEPAANPRYSLFEEDSWENAPQEEMTEEAVPDESDASYGYGDGEEAGDEDTYAFREEFSTETPDDDGYAPMGVFDTDAEDGSAETLTEDSDGEDSV